MQDTVTQHCSVTLELVPANDNDCSDCVGGCFNWSFCQTTLHMASHMICTLSPDLPDDRTLQLLASSVL